MQDEEETVDRFLERDPDNISALVRKGDLRSRAGDDRAAIAFYKAALAAAAEAGPLPLSLKPAIERAQQCMAQAAKGFESYLEGKLTEAGFGPRHRPPRFQHSLDLMLGRRQTDMRLQRPTSYFFPGLPPRRFYERSEFPWAGHVEAASESMHAELLSFLGAKGDRFSPYIVNDPSRPPGDFHGMRDNPAWSTLYLWEKGGPVTDLQEFFPTTLGVVRQVDLPHITVRAPSILFSRLSPGARIPPHHGMLNARLICHLPLVVPPDCGFRVGGEKREWRPGELLIFDDTVEHEAWNGGTRDRVILIFDIWRPELSLEERAAITAMFEAVDAYER